MERILRGKLRILALEKEFRLFVRHNDWTEKEFCASLTLYSLVLVLSSVSVAPRLSQDGSSIAGLGLMSGGGGLPLGGSLSRGSLHATRGSLMSTVSSLVGPQNKQSSTTLASLAGLMAEGGTPHRQVGGDGGGKDYSHREKSSAHNSRDSLAYAGASREGPQWEAVGTVDYREKRSHGGSRGSSMSGITFLSREAVPVGPSAGGPGAPTDPLEWEWEMGPSDMTIRAAGSVHSLQSSSSSIARQGGTPPPPPPSIYAHEGSSEGKFSGGYHDAQQPRSYSHAHPKTTSRHPSPSCSQEGGQPPPTEKRRKHHAPHRVRVGDGFPHSGLVHRKCQMSALRPNEAQNQT